MKSDSFSGFSSLKAGEVLKQRIMRDIESGGAGRAKRRRLLRRFILSVACLAAVVIAGAALISLRNASGFKGDFMIMNHPPVETRFNTAVSDAVAPSEKGLFASSDTILYGKVEGFKWVVLGKEKGAFFRYRTILTVRVSNVYRGDLKPGKTVDILLPFSISGTGSGVWVEDNENACKLKKGSEAFFFANKFGDSDLIGDSSWNLHAKDISAYGTGWGDQYILPAQSGVFSYLFEPNKTLTFQDVETVIKAG